MKKRNTLDIMGNIIITVGVLLILIALWKIGSILWEYHQGKSEYRDLQELAFDMDAAGQSDEGSGSQANDDEADEKSWAANAANVQQALSELKEQNGDTVGWIDFENIDLSYPIMWCDNNEYYLRRTFSGEVNSAGSIFMETTNNPDFEDYHTLIYGHNMRNQSMFGQLKKYKSNDFYEGNEYFVIYTEENAWRYQIFAYYDISESGDVYTVGFAPGEVFDQFVKKMLSRSYYDTGVEVSGQDKVITLSTCATEGVRFVVHAKRVDEL